MLCICDNGSSSEDLAIFFVEDAGLAASNCGFGVADVDCGIDSEWETECVSS